VKVSEKQLEGGIQGFKRGAKRIGLNSVSFLKDSEAGIGEKGKTLHSKTSKLLHRDNSDAKWGIVNPGGSQSCPRGWKVPNSKERFSGERDT